MLLPKFDRFKELAKLGNVIPVYKELLADMETPPAIFSRLANYDYSFLLESVEGGEKLARYSFIGFNPREIFSSKDNKISITTNGKTKTFITENSPIDELKNLLSKYKAVNLDELPRFAGGAVGYLSYDAVRFFEDIPQNNADDLNVPELNFMLTKSLIAFDHVKHRIIIIANAYCDGRSLPEIYADAEAEINKIIDLISKPLTFKPVAQIDSSELSAVDHKTPPSNYTQEEFKDIVERCKEYIRAGDIIQVVPSQRFEFSTEVDSFSLYRALRCINPSPYMFLLNFKDMSLVGSSPEIMVTLENRTVELRPIAGTRRRGINDAEDLAFEKELINDEKERAEHTMLVDLGRNDVGRVCEFKSVCVPELMVIERYSHVMHIVSDVKGKLLKDKDAFDLLAATFPAGTVSGAPKIRAMEIIDEMEKCRRGPYAGTVCYLGYDGNLDSCITIRTILLKNNKAYVQAGGGIVADSIPQLEYKETVNKARAMIKAICLAENLIK